MMTDWSRPRALGDVDVAFPADALEWMPAWEEIPEEFRRGGTSWHRLQNVWFYRGLKDPQFYPKPGVDPQIAVRHLQAIQGSYAPKHEHKVAAVAWLASLWFEQVEYDEDGDSKEQSDG